MVEEELGISFVKISLHCSGGCWLGDRKGIRPVKKLGVGLLVVTVLTGALHSL